MDPIELLSFDDRRGDACAEISLTKSGTTEGMAPLARLAGAIDGATLGT